MQKLLILALSLLNPFVLLAQSPTYTSTSAWLQENNLPILGLGIIENAQLSRIEVYGDYMSDKKAAYNTIFNVASLTKPITTMVVLKLVSQNKWDLDEALSNYWIDPDVKNDDRLKLLTTRHVLSHQSGFPNWRNGKLEFMFTPGTKYQYSGEGFEYLRRALEARSHQTLDQLAEELIFEPLGMEDTQYFMDSTTDVDRLAPSYDTTGAKYTLYNRTAANAADDLITTIADYGSFLASVMNHEGLSDVVYQSMQHPEVPTHNSKHFCLGFERYDFKDGNYALSHGGADKGSQCIFFIFPKTKQGLLIFTDIDDGYKVFEKLIVEHLGDYGKEIVQIELGRNLLSDGHDTEGSAHHKRNNYHGDSTLYQTISSLDSVFFNAYNNCDLETQSRMYADDIEFYHDLVGLTTSKGEIIEATKRNICGRVTRERMEGSIEVYSIADYGAVQLGLHKFHNSDNPDERPESSRFIIIWKAEENHWKISRVISLH